MKKLKLHGFNNLTKSLSFCIYDICYAKTAEERDGYIAYIDELYNANRLTEILSETCSIIGANILNIARQDYEPQGASVTILVSEEPVDPRLIDTTEHPGPLPEAVVAHLDKSHICVHTYPESTLNNPSLRTLAVGLYALRGENVVDWTGIAAGASIAIVPVICVFIALQKYFVDGIAGAVKS